ncbi:unnamed protein product [Candidula unifasciata]|uniref:C2H2-type domain-containing protein n=1 Tax=Candidula unifasciata TaxID=100452 RepID=A0A8S3YUD5_9EUPU|nr:unnamed protein product [Candidula unifasciata]
MGHSFPKALPPPMLYHNFTPLNSCNIVTTNGFFNLNTPSDMPKHSFEEVLNIPPAFNTDSTMNAQMMMPKTHYHELISSVASENRHYFQDPANSFVQNLNTIPHDLQMTEARKQSRCYKTESKTVTNIVSTDNVQVKNNNPVGNDIDKDNLIDKSADDVVASANIMPNGYDKDAYKCGFCEMKCLSSEILLDHLNTHTNVLPYHCGICGAAFIDVNQLMRHVRQSHNVKPPFACGLCTSTFHQSEELKEHIETHEKPPSINKIKLPSAFVVKEKIKSLDKADESPKEEETEEEADDDDDDEFETENMNSSALMNSTANTIIISKDTNFSLRKGPSKIVMDDVDLSSVCTVIIEPSSAGGIRKKHLFKCNYCEKVCKDKGSLVSHVRTHTKGRPYECNVCLARFKQYAHLSDHVMTKHTKDRPFVCDRCAKTFNRKSHLQDHIRLRHTDDKLYHCSDCSATFQKRTEYSEHKRIHGKPPKYQCNLCPRQFRNVTDYERHIRSHTKEKRFECEVCHLTFGLLANAKKHMVKHSEDRPFKCEVCPKAYHFEHDYKRHQLTHINKKPFPCTDCYKSFKNASLLKKHSKEAHMKSEEDPTKKPFKCLTCRKRFKIQWDLDRHRKIHAKKKPFLCLYCYKSYGSEAMLVKHTKVHEGQDLPLYDHSKDLIDESLTEANRKKRGRKSKLKNEPESKIHSDETASKADEKLKSRGRPSRQKTEIHSQRAGLLKLSLRRKKIKETAEKSAPRIKVRLRHKQLRKRSFRCPDCNQPFLNEATLKKHSKIHEEEYNDNTEDDSQQCLYQNDSKNEGATNLASFNKNANDATSINDSSQVKRNDRLNKGVSRGDDSTQDEDTSCDNDVDDATSWNSSSESQHDENSALELVSIKSKKTIVKKKTGVPLCKHIGS